MWRPTGALCILPPHCRRLHESRNKRSCLTSGEHLFETGLFFRLLISFENADNWQLRIQSLCALLSSLTVIGPAGLEHVT